MEEQIKEIRLATAVANCWIEKKLPSNKQATLDDEIQKFKTALIERLLNRKPRMINNGNLSFNDLPYAPKFPWIFWTYVDWENCKIITRQGTTFIENSS